jgi:NAD(P)-dependent dehydrogenase (short-subunit alcohol dehydrogenase family)
MARRWTAAEVSDQSGRVAVVTGGNTGLGFVTARVLAARGVTVVLACRDAGRAAAAAERIRAAAPGAAVEFGPPGRLQFTGHPAKVRSSPQSYEVAAQRRLWELSEGLTGVTIDVRKLLTNQ